MFKINNRSLIRRIAKQNLKYNRQNVFFILLTLIISVAIIFSAILVIMNKEQVHRDTQDGKAQVVILGLIDGQLSEIMNSEGISWVGQQTNLNVIEDKQKKYLFYGKIGIK